MLKAIRRKGFGPIAALMLAVVALGAGQATSALAYDAKIRVFRSSDGKVVLICHYNEKDVLLYCDVATT